MPDVQFDPSGPTFTWDEEAFAGENREVREDRRCTFYVAVWDATSEMNQRRYKRAHNEIVQAVFNTYEYRQKPWPHHPNGRSNR